MYNQGIIVAVSKSETHSFSKDNVSSIRLIAGKGVEGDAHCGGKVRHRSRVRINPDQPNLRQVHLIHQELFDELEELGYKIKPGQIGENITTRGLDLLSLPVGTRLKIGGDSEIAITGLRNPCNQLNIFKEGLMQQLIYKDSNGQTVRKSGVMAIVLQSGEVRAEDRIAVRLPPKPWQKLDRV